MPDRLIQIGDTSRGALRATLTQLAQAATRLEETLYLDGVPGEQGTLMKAQRAAEDLQDALTGLLNPLGALDARAIQEFRRGYAKSMRDLRIYRPL